MFSKDKKSKAPEPVSTEREDDLGPFPADVDDSPTRQRVVERALRMTTIGLAVSAVSNVAFVSLIIAMFPLKEISPYIMTVKEKDDQIVALEPLATGAPGIQYATEANVRQYVKLRHGFTPVNSIMDARWGSGSQLSVMTTEAEFAEFSQSASAERLRLMELGMNRDIRIESATMIRPDTWQVNFVTNESRGGAGGTLSSGALADSDATPEELAITASSIPTNTRRWLATMTINYEPQRVSYDQRLLNPLGFTVTDYSVTERN